MIEPAAGIIKPTFQEASKPINREIKAAEQKQDSKEQVSGLVNKVKNWLKTWRNARPNEVIKDISHLDTLSDKPIEEPVAAKVEEQLNTPQVNPIAEPASKDSENIDTQTDPLSKTELSIKIESHREQAERIIFDMQTVLGIRLNLNILDIHPGTTNRWGISPSYEDPDGNKRASLYTTPNIDMEGEGNISPSDKHKFAHETGHALIEEAKDKASLTNLVTSYILDEGIVEYGALGLQGTTDQVDLNFLRDQIGKQSDLIIECVNNPTPKSVNELKGIAAKDGYSQDERRLIHIIGLNFVATVLPSDRIWAWPVLINNLPTSEEVLNPQLYKTRLQEKIETYQKPQILPSIPLLNPK